MKVTINDEFWNYYRDLVAKKVVPYQWLTLNDAVEGAEPSHAIKNFQIAAGDLSGEYYGAVFQDSDLYKWIEMTAYSLKYNDSKETRQNLDYTIKLIERAQEDNGYLNTYYQLKAPDKKWTNLRDHHELYCAGHLLEAAVACQKILNDDRLLKVSKRFVEHIKDIFGYDKKRGYPGHQEIELALLKAYDITGDEDYLELADYFIFVRGESPHFFDKERESRDPKDLIWNQEPNFNFGLAYEYQQAHKPIVEQLEAVGHSVRAVYYYASISKLLKQSPNNELFNTIRLLWEDVVNRKMYVTGGIGANENGESFGNAYDLPNDTMYCETCASIGLIFFANELSKISDDSAYAEIIETILYNSSISGMNIDGDRFFYVNPLEVNMDYISDLKYSHVKPERQKWLSVACCPPNLGRLIASLDNYIYNYENNRLTINQYISGEVNINDVTLEVESNMPYSEKIIVRVLSGSEVLTKGLRVRKASWMVDLEVTINGVITNCEETDGYLIFNNLEDNSIIELDFKMNIQELKSNPKVVHNINKIALRRGALVYCIEEADNGKDVLQTIIPKDVVYELGDEKIINSYQQDINYKSIKFNGYKLNAVDNLYYDGNLQYTKYEVKAIPYHLWANRETGNMTVWINKENKF